MKKSSPLFIVQVENNSKLTQSSIRQKKRQEVKDYLKKIWEFDPERFNPNRNVLEKERISRTLSLFSKINKPKLAVDIGCGFGFITKKINSLGSKTIAIDVAKQALDLLKEEDIILKEEYMPHTTLEDCQYDLVVCTEVIAYLPREEHRLFFSELSRVINKEGRLICSTNVDIDSIDALQRFLDLAQTEFDFEEIVYSYHRLYIKLNNLVEAPSRFIKASKNLFFKEEAIKQRRGFYKQWYKWNSKRWSPYLWRIPQIIFYPLNYILKNNSTVLLFLEKLSKAIWMDDAISHVIFVAKKRPIMGMPSPENVPIERKEKKHVWE